MTKVTNHTIITDHEGNKWLSIFDHRGSHFCVEAPPMTELGKFPPRDRAIDTKICIIRPSMDNVRDIETSIA